MAPNRYAAAHTPPHGAGDARPTAIQIIKDSGLEGKLPEKTILVTGCSSGISIETARALATTGATLFLSARDIPKATGALSGILSPGKAELLHCDLSSLSSVRACAQEFLEKSNKLNILICNAGLVSTQPTSRFVSSTVIQTD
jgi:NAD(P)-dependent dehydrogenase (short-subunit alcohol dehydrogenase family)